MYCSQSPRTCHEHTISGPRSLTTSPTYHPTHLNDSTTYHHRHCQCYGNPLRLWRFRFGCSQ